MDLTSNSTRNESLTLSQKAAKGGFWVFLLRIVGLIFGFVRLIILAHFLSPNDYGLFAIALVVMSTLKRFSQTGFQAALIQKKGNIEPYLNSTWTTTVIRGCVLFAILFFIAPFAANLFRSPDVTWVIRIIGISILLNGFANTGIIYFQKELKFNKKFTYQLSGILTDLIVTITLLVLLKNVWALVLGVLAGNVAKIIASYLFHPYRPKFELNLTKVKELFRFGKWVFGSNILVFLITEGDDIFVGWYLGAAALGLYRMAYRISNMPATEYSALIASVMYPAYSKLQDNLHRLKEAYLKVLQLTAFLAIPIAGMIFILAPDFTGIFLGEKWMYMIPAMQVLALYGLLRAIGATTGVVFLAVGKPKIRTKIQTGQLILLAILIYPLTKYWGILGTSIAVTAYALVFNIVAVYKVLRIVNSEYKRPFKVTMLPLIGTLATVFLIFVMRNYVFVEIGLIHFLILVVLGVFTYMLLTYLFDKFLGYGSRKLVKEQFALLLRSKRA